MKRKIKYRFDIILLVLFLILLLSCKEHAQVQVQLQTQTQVQAKQDSNFNLCDIFCEEAKEKAKLEQEIKELEVKKDIFVDDILEKLMHDKSNKNDIKYNNATVASYLSVADKGAAKKYDSICNKISYMKDSLTRVGHNPYCEHYWKKTFGESFEDFEKAISVVSVYSENYISKVIRRRDASVGEWTSFAKKLYDLRLYEWNKSYGNVDSENYNWRVRIFPSDSNNQIIKFSGYGKYPHNWKEFEKIIRNIKGEGIIVCEDRVNSYSRCPDDIIIDDESIRSKRDFLLIFNAYRHILNQIYSKHLKHRPGFSGKITFKFTVAANGEINSIEIIKSTTSYPEFDNEIKNKVSTWKWKPIEKGSVTVSADFYFTE